MIRYSLIIIRNAMLGAAVAFVIGYFLAAGVVAMGTAALTGLPGGPEAAAAGRQDLFSLAGLKFLAFHTVAVTGSAAGERTTIHPPLTLFTLIPVIALLIGGYIATRSSSHARLRDRLLSGAMIAPFYAAIALILRPLFTADLAPYQDLQVGGFLNPLPPMIAGGAFVSTLLFTLAFGAVFGLLGGLRASLPEGFWRGLFGTNPIVPGWLKGSLAAFLIMQIALTTFLAAAGIGVISMRRQALAEQEIYGPAKLAVLALAPQGAGIASYFFQGGQLEGIWTTHVDEFGMATRVSASIFLGAREVTRSRLNGEQVDVRRMDISPFAFVGLIFTAAVFLLAGHLAMRTSRPNSVLQLGIGIALAHTAIMLAAIPLYSASILRNWEVPAGVGRSFAGYSVSPWTVATFGFAIALVFSLIGALTAPRTDRSART